MKMDDTVVEKAEETVAAAPEVVVETTPVAKDDAPAAPEAAPEAAPTPAPEAAPVAEAVAKAESDKAEVLAKMATLEKALAEAKAEANAKVEALQKALDDEREQKEIREAVAKAASDFGHLPAKAEDIGPALRTLRKAAPDAANKVEALLKQVDALLNQTLAPVGVSKADTIDDNAWAKVQRLAKAKVEKGEVASLAKAIDAVLVENKDLYTAIQAEKNG